MHFLYSEKTLLKEEDVKNFHRCRETTLLLLNW